MKILEPLMPYIQKINDESETKPDTATSAGECAKGDNIESNQEPTKSSKVETKEQDLDGETDESDEDEMSEKSKQLMMMLYQVLQGFTFDFLFSIHVVSMAVLNYYRYQSCIFFTFKIEAHIIKKMT